MTEEDESELRMQYQSLLLISFQNIQNYLKFVELFMLFSYYLFTIPVFSSL